MSDSTRRGFITSAISAGAAVGAGSLIGAAASSAGVAAPAGELLNLAGMPYRQDDPRWGKKLMWDRKEVVTVAREFNDETRADANSLLYPYRDGNKRIGFLVMVTFLGVNGLEFEAAESEVVAEMLRLAEGTVSEEQLTTWVRAHSR